jgi:signal transduction histidine kinase
MRVDELRLLGIFDGLTDSQLATLVEGSAETTIEPGVDLFREGEHADSWWVLLEGSIDLIRRLGREEQVVARMGQPGQWAGGFRAWDEQGVYLATGRGATPGRALCVPADVLRDLSNEWFPLAGHLIRGLFNTARSIESTARQRDALVTLGTLAAGLAHEINNPASAAVRAVDSLEDAAQTLLSALRRLADGEVTAAQFAALDDLRRGIEGLASDPDPLARSDREQAVSAWLARREIEQPWLIAPALATSGVDADWLEKVAAGLDGPALAAGLQWVASTIAVSGLLSELRASSARISELVGAVRSYSQMDRSSMQTIDVSEGLESTLAMLAHKLRDGVEVVRDYSVDVPRIEAYAGELNQVWTNLIDNAVDAMDGRGTLRLSTRIDGGSVVVEVGDTGGGMSPEVARRAFEAFFTTKDVGKGTGLGLDIARRIVVERHAGDISVESHPGRTVVRVRLPMDASR